MFGPDHLALRIFRLRSPSEWLNPERSFALVFPKGGLGTFVSTGIKHPLAPGDVLVLKEARGGKVRVAHAGELVFGCFDFCLEHLYPLFGNDEMSLLRDITEFFRIPRRYPASSLLAQECHRLLDAAPSDHQMDHRGQLLRVVTAILSAEFRNARRKRAGFSNIGGRVNEVLVELLATDFMSLSVGELADKLHCGSRHLNRIFHRHFGFSAAAVKMEMRLIKAMTLLRSREAKVADVAGQCGFNHLGLFHACFKHRFGVSPGRWRDSNLSTGVRPSEPIRSDLLCPVHGVRICPWAGQNGGATPTHAPRERHHVRCHGS